jgi:large subunit ribosomal protein L10
MPSKRNVDSLKKTKEQLEHGTAYYFTDFTGLSVHNLEHLRRELKKLKGDYVVLKNTIGYLAMKDLGYDKERIRELFTGPTGIAIAFEDPIMLAKVITGHENLKIKGSFIEGQYFIADDVIRFSKIPSKDALIGNVVGSMNIIGSFVYTLENIIRNFVGTIDAMKDKEAK